METVIRVVLIYLAILLGLRILGKREFGQLSPLELISLLLIPEIVSPALHQDDISITNAVIALSTLLSMVFLTSLARYLFEHIEKAISGEPSILVSHGTFIEMNLHKERVDPAEIFSEMHKSGLYELKQVKWAILETDGKISIVAESETQQSTSQPSDKNATT
jgi:uncharacterized membrane protein YcaP (DUF421 family)